MGVRGGGGRGGGGGGCVCVWGGGAVFYIFLIYYLLDFTANSEMASFISRLANETLQIILRFNENAPLLEF